MVGVLRVGGGGGGGCGRIVSGVSCIDVHFISFQLASRRGWQAVCGDDILPTPRVRDARRANSETKNRFLTRYGLIYRLVCCVCGRRLAH